MSRKYTIVKYCRLLFNLFYTYVRALCQLEVATEFSDLSDTMSPEHIDKLKSVYNHVDDIDLYIAGLMETPTFGSLLGPTFSYIIANQVNKQT